MTQVQTSTDKECVDEPPTIQTTMTSINAEPITTELPHFSYGISAPHHNKIQQRKSTHYRSKGVQCRPVKHRSKGVQVGEGSVITASTNLPTPVCDDVIDDDYLESEPPSPVPDDVEHDPDWIPQTMVDNDDVEMDLETSKEPVRPVRKFAIYEPALLALFTVCHLCFAHGASAEITSITGTMITVTQACSSCGEHFHWESQPKTGSIPDGNLSLSAAICFAGALPRKLVRVLKFWGLAAISANTFFRHQRLYIHSVIRNVWSRQQDSLLENLKDNDTIQLAGDARCDSMGHCAKYGSYSLHDTQHNKLICMELVQSTEVKSRYHMELEGLKRTLTKLEAVVNEKAVCLVTDRHPQIQKWLRENKPTIMHFYDVWHIAKGLKKTLGKFSQSRGNELVQKWQQSIINHLYWCARSSDGNGDMAEARWVSLLNHIIDKHDHDNQLFSSCEHTTGLTRAWFQPGTEVYESLTEILTKRCLIQSIRKMSSDGQTSSLEGYHSTLTHFAPKMYHFGYTAMKSRLQLAALHFNENAGRAQAVNKKGEEQFTIKFPKFKKGGHTVEPIKQSCTFDYVIDLQMELQYMVSNRIETVMVEQIPRPLAYMYSAARPNKDDAVKHFRSRFSI